MILELQYDFLLEPQIERAKIRREIEVLEWVLAEPLAHARGWDSWKNNRKKRFADTSVLRDAKRQKQK